LTSQEYFLERAKFMDIRKIFEYALQREFEGKNFFQQNAERLNHAAAVGAFQQLAAEEQKHIDFIQSMLNKMNEGTKLEKPGRSLCKTPASSPNVSAANF
jgi:rubrerythrin